MARMFLGWLFANSSFSVDRNSKMAATARRSQNIGPYWKMKKIADTINILNRKGTF
jgi:hypothetical protein